MLSNFDTSGYTVSDFIDSLTHSGGLQRLESNEIQCQSLKVEPKAPSRIL